ncbi:hypothetical protein ISU95_07025 [Enterobacter cloacae]|uniref:hypothetical protein n=1 Tax=Enterobacter cloacae TaxID=550 RepID=UPI00188C2A9B|nr:hypothetical protein [Enterobacter cloacae]MBF4156775.1 hypothetical protein [Enterobacter cloacae]HAS0921050.1 hypothetical protein [Enterobacter cloacae]
MSTFTKEQLIASAHARIEFAEMMLAGELEPLKERTWSIELELARIALASLEAEPVAWTWEIYGGGNMYAKIKPESLDARPLYTAPPSPVSVPDEVTAEDCPAFVKYDVTDADDAWARGFNACRNATLQGAENAESTTTMKTAPALDSSPRIAESPSGINQGKSEPVTTANKLRDAVETIRNSGIAIDGEKILAERDALNSPVIPDGLRLALSNAGIAAPESDEMLAATCEKYIQELVTWVKDRKPFRSAAPQQEVTQALAKGMERYGDAMQELAKKEVK